MELRESQKLKELWLKALNCGANTVLIRHGPKSGSNESGLSEEGKYLTKEYSFTLRDVFKGLFMPVLVCTDKIRTADTLKLLFSQLFSPLSYNFYFRTPRLNSPVISQGLQNKVVELHNKYGHFRGYFLNQTYYFFERLGGDFMDYDADESHSEVSRRMAIGINEDLSFIRKRSSANSVIYCGHSPAIELGLESLLGISLPELGGFLNPLDSVHLKIDIEKMEFVARINPIVGYRDIESESYYGNTGV